MRRRITDALFLVTIAVMAAFVPIGAATATALEHHCSGSGPFCAEVILDNSQVIVR